MLECAIKCEEFDKMKEIYKEIAFNDQNINGENTNKF